MVRTKGATYPEIGATLETYHAMVRTKIQASQRKCIMIHFSNQTPLPSGGAGGWVPGASGAPGATTFSVSSRARALELKRIPVIIVIDP